MAPARTYSRSIRTNWNDIASEKHELTRSEETDLFSRTSSGSSSSQGDSYDVRVDGSNFLLLLWIGIGEFFVVERDEGEFMKVRGGRGKGGSLSPDFDYLGNLIRSEGGSYYLSTGLARRAEYEHYLVGCGGHDSSTKAVGKIE